MEYMKNIDYEKNRHSCYYLKYHLVVVIKYRHPVLAIPEIKNQLIEISYRLFEKEWQCRIENINTDKDHIHILFVSKPQVQLSKLINNYKTVTSRLLRKQFAEQLKPYFWKPYFWSDSYFIGTVSEVTESMIYKYIDDQGKK